MQGPLFQYQVSDICNINCITFHGIFAGQVQMKCIISLPNNGIIISTFLISNWCVIELIYNALKNQIL